MKWKFLGLSFLILLLLFFLGLGNQLITIKKLATDPIPPQFTEKSLFLSPIVRATEKPSDQVVTGITVPHHLLAADLIAQAFKFASNRRPDQIVLFSPDHFDLGTTDVSISDRNFSTVFGTLNNDFIAVNELEKLPFIKAEDFFYREHGLGAELPFIRYYFPNARIIALTFKESTRQNELDQTVEALKKVLNKNSLIVQSTDFSHYLTAAAAEARDQQTTQVLEQGDPHKLFSLTQPDNIDSIASQYVQMRLQQEFFSSKLQILAHKNSQSYTPDKLDSTTSYIVQAYLSQ